MYVFIQPGYFSRLGATNSLPAADSSTDVSESPPFIPLISPLLPLRRRLAPCNRCRTRWDSWETTGPGPLSVARQAWGTRGASQFTRFDEFRLEKRYIHTRTRLTTSIRCWVHIRPLLPSI